LLPGLAAAAPFVIFGVIYVLAVQPKRALEHDAKARAASLGAELVRAQAVAPRTPVSQDVMQREFQELVPIDDRSSEVADALRRLLKNSTAGGARNLTIETGDAVRPGSDALGSRITSFDGPIAYRPLAVTFDSRTAELTPFFSGLRTMPTIVELGGVEIAPAPTGRLMRTRLLLFVYQRSEAAASAARATAPQPVAASQAVAPPQRVAPLIADARRQALESAPHPASRTPKGGPKRGSASPVPRSEPDPVVHTILFSSQHKVALVDGRIVRAGDRLGSGQVQAIEQNSVTFLTDTGLVKHLVLNQPRIRATKR
jgi:hypothetical protein